jgi:hypothetical protein
MATIAGNKIFLKNRLLDILETQNKVDSSLSGSGYDMRDNLRNSVIDRKRAEEVLNQREECFRKKLENNLSPAREVENHELAEIIDVQAIQPLVDDFYKLTKIPIGLNDLKGNVLGRSRVAGHLYQIPQDSPGNLQHCVESNTNLSQGFPRESLSCTGAGTICGTW